MADVTLASTSSALSGATLLKSSGSPATGALAKFSAANSLTSGDLSGDVTTSGSLVVTIANNAVTTAKINNAAVTLAKIQNASANSKLLGSGASGSGSPYTEITLGTNLSMSGTTLNASAGAGAMVLLESQTASGSASLEFTSFSSTYNNYILTFENVVVATNGADVLMTWADAGGYFATNYRYVSLYRGTATALGSNTSASASSIKVWGSASSSAPLNGQLFFLNTQATSGYTSITGDMSGLGNSAEFFWGNLGATHALTAAITKLKIAASSGNLTTGVLRLYGIAKV